MKYFFLRFNPIEAAVTNRPKERPSVGLAIASELCPMVWKLNSVSSIRCTATKRCTGVKPRNRSARPQWSDPVAPVCASVKIWVLGVKHPQRGTIMTISGAENFHPRCNGARTLYRALERAERSAMHTIVIAEQRIEMQVRRNCCKEIGFGMNGVRMRTGICP